MDFLKKHYEKIVLALVLLSLTAAAGFLLFYIPGEQHTLDVNLSSTDLKNPPALPPLDTKLEDDALKRIAAPYKIDLVTKHRVFNPVLWQMHAGGRLTKIDSSNQAGPEAVQVVAINPIYLTVTYVTNMVNGYQIKQRDDTSARPSDRPGVVHLDSSTDMFILRKVEGAPESPTALLLEFKNPTHEQFTLKANPDEPFKKVIAYSADLRYPPEPTLQWNKIREAGPGVPAAQCTLTIDGTVYKVIDVESNSVIISAPNNKRTTRPFPSRPSE